MDPLHAFASADGPHLDGQGRWALHLADGRDSRLSSHGRRRSLLALHHRLRICSDRRVFCHWTVHDRSMATARADLARYLRAGVEDFRPLRQPPHSARTEWVLQLQCAPAAFLFRHDLHHGAALHPHRHGHVAGVGESLPDLRPIIRWPPGRAFDSLPDAHRIHRLYRRARDAGRDSRVSRGT